MSTLWEYECARGSHVLRRSTLAELGGEGDHQDHLDGELDALAPDDYDTALAVFGYLVTPSGADRVDRPDLADSVERPTTASWHCWRSSRAKTSESSGTCRRLSERASRTIATRSSTTSSGHRLPTGGAVRSSTADAPRTRENASVSSARSPRRRSAPWPKHEEEGVPAVGGRLDRAPPDRRGSRDPGSDFTPQRGFEPQRSAGN